MPFIGVASIVAVFLSRKKQNDRYENYQPVHRSGSRNDNKIPTTCSMMTLACSGVILFGTGVWYASDRNLERTAMGSGHFFEFWRRNDSQVVSVSAGVSICTFALGKQVFLHKLTGLQSLALLWCAQQGVILFPRNVIFFLNEMSWQWLCLRFTLLLTFRLRKDLQFFTTQLHRTFWMPTVITQRPVASGLIHQQPKASYTTSSRPHTLVA